MNFDAYKDIKLDSIHPYGLLLCEAVDKEYTLFMDYESKRTKIFSMNVPVFGINKHIYKRNFHGQLKSEAHKGFTQDIRQEAQSGDVIVLLVEIFKNYCIPRHILVSPELYNKAYAAFNHNDSPALSITVSTTCLLDLADEVKKEILKR